MGSRRRVALFSFGLTLSIVVMSCAPASTATPVSQAVPSLAIQTPSLVGKPESNVPSGETVEIKVMWWGSLDRHRRTLKVIQLFQQHYPHIRVTSEFAGIDPYWTAMNEMTTRSEFPDVMQQDYAHLADWSARGLLLSLDDYVREGVLSIADVPEDALQSCRVGDHLVAINLGVTSQCWVLDIDAFKRARIALPSQGWTWYDFERITLALHHNLGIWGMGSGMWDEQIWNALYLSTGSWRYSATGTELGYDDDRPLVEYLSMLVRLQQAKALIPRATELASYNVGTEGIKADPIISGRAAMARCWSHEMRSLWQAAGEGRNLKLVPVPRIVGGRSANYVGASTFWSVTSGSQHPREAVLFINFFINSIEANEILMAERGVPVSVKVREAIRPKLDKIQAEMFDYINKVSQDAQPTPPSEPPGHSDIVKNVLGPKVFDPVAYGKLAPRQAATTLRQEASLILAGYGNDITPGQATPVLRN